MGGLIGGLIPFILNYNRSEVASVNDDTYIGFMCFMSTGTVLMLAILHPSRVVRDDDNHCTNIKYSDVLTEAVEILKLFQNWKMLLMVPAAWASTRPRPAPRAKIQPVTLVYAMGSHFFLL
ncbi:UNC93-like protein 1 [Vitis vinifera]|uniref:UNC93-like protein 1 n=1 Tax=Vitis vinifera TaxID=29760 RepID=A0A438DZW3_VITVI|nr:UNC93-like protein 1 [Vitis vinifera]